MKRADGGRPERDVPTLVRQDSPEAGRESGEPAVTGGGVDDDLVGGHRQHPLCERVVERREANKAHFDLRLVAATDRV